MTVAPSMRATAAVANSAPPWIPGIAAMDAITIASAGDKPRNRSAIPARRSNDHTGTRVAERHKADALRGVGNQRSLKDEGRERNLRDEQSQARCKAGRETRYGLV